MKKQSKRSVILCSPLLQKEWLVSIGRFWLISFNFGLQLILNNFFDWFPGIFLAIFKLRLTCIFLAIFKLEILSRVYIFNTKFITYFNKSILIIFFLLFSSKSKFSHAIFTMFSSFFLILFIIFLFSEFSFS